MALPFLPLVNVTGTRPSRPAGGNWYSGVSFPSNFYGGDDAGARYQDWPEPFADEPAPEDYPAPAPAPAPEPEPESAGLPALVPVPELDPQPLPQKPPTIKPVPEKITPVAPPEPVPKIEPIPERPFVPGDPQRVIPKRIFEPIPGSIVSRIVNLVLGKILLNPVALAVAALLKPGNTGPPGTGNLVPGQPMFIPPGEDRDRRPSTRPDSPGRDQPALFQLPELVVNAWSDRQRPVSRPFANPLAFDLPFAAPAAPRFDPFPVSYPDAIPEELPRSEPRPVPRPLEIPFNVPEVRPNPRPNPQPQPTPEPNPFVDPIPEFQPFADPIAPPRGSPRTPPLTPRNPDPVTFGTLNPVPDIGPVPMEALDKCPPCAKPKPKKPRQERQKCFKGTYTESRKSTKKFPKEEIPCP